MGNQTGSLHPQAICDLVESTAFSYSEVCDLYRQYRRDCSDARTLEMKVEDFRRIYREYFPNSDNTDQFAQLIFKSFDKENRGKITYREFMMTLSVQLKGTEEEKINWMFDLYDINRNGYISRSEVIELIDCMQKMDARSAVSLLQQTTQSEQNTKSAAFVANVIFEAANLAQSDQISKPEFLNAAKTSALFKRTIRKLNDTASYPYTERRKQSGSFGIPRRESTVNTMRKVSLEENKINNSTKVAEGRIRRAASAAEFKSYESTATTSQQQEAVTSKPRSQAAPRRATAPAYLSAPKDNDRLAGTSRSPAKKEISTQEEIAEEPELGAEETTNDEPL